MPSQENQKDGLKIRDLSNAEINSIRMLYGAHPFGMYQSTGLVKSRRQNTYLYDSKMETYLKHRKKRGRDDMRVHQNFGSWLRSVESEGKKFGLSLDLLSEVENAYPNAVDKMCLILMERIIERKEIEKTGAVHARAHPYFDESNVM